tara:strand:- start:536 stop:1258 length:723 start_codon:yes stop_codon:yes gene_type:complete
MKKYFIDEIETFAINTPVDATVELMGWQEIPIVYVDNFYKNPDMVRNLALRCPGTKNPRVLGGVPGERVDMNMNLESAWPIWTEITESVFGLKEEEKQSFQISCMNVAFSVNVTQSTYRRRLPHIDLPDVNDRGWAGLVYLNKPKECKGGTAFYTYKGQQVNPYQEGIWGNKKEDWWEQAPDEHFVNDSVGPWEKIHLAEMKYNRMIMYPANVLHSPYDKKGFFTDDIYRLTQVFFIPLT